MPLNQISMWYQVPGTNRGRAEIQLAPADICWNSKASLAATYHHTVRIPHLGIEGIRQLPIGVQLMQRLFNHVLRLSHGYPVLWFVLEKTQHDGLERLVDGIRGIGHMRWKFRKDTVKHKLRFLLLILTLENIKICQDGINNVPQRKVIDLQSESVLRVRMGY